MMDLKKYLPFTIFFILIFILNLITFDIITQYRVVVKPLIVASLLGFYISNTKFQSNTFILALIFALLGDIFLLFEDETMFIIGLICFLLMQLCYIFIFNIDRSAKPRWVAIVLCVLVGIVFYILLHKKLGSMQLPVIAYILAIITMTIMAIQRKREVAGYFLVTVGAIFFMISDSCLAWDKFAGTFEGAKYIIMATYMLAQYAIVRGMIEYGNKFSPQSRKL
jgi:uncharacterized membrane protein YhhN